MSDIGNACAETWLFFDYEVRAGDLDMDGVSVEAGSIDLNGGSITGAAGVTEGTDANLSHNGITDDANRKVNGGSAGSGRPPSDPRPGSGGGGGGGGNNSRNEAPEAAQAIGDRAVQAGAALGIELPNAFDDPDDDDLTYKAESSDPAVAAVNVNDDMLMVRGVGEGTARITVTATDADGESASQTFTVTITGPEAVWYLPPASDSDRQGFVRVVNHSDSAGEATVTATDDEGFEREPLTLALGPRQARHFNTTDLEDGNPAKGLTGAAGASAGGWRLAIDGGGLDVEALAYIRTPDGFVTAMN
ncbi:MAG: hypothetical protein F4Z60_08565, partial [Chloroflexi bacterium]|nr:hypothetical protein [Chloroflexota bacterium]